MSAQSQNIIDRLIPDFRNQLNDDFLTSLKRRAEVIRRLPAVGGIGTDLEMLIQRYEQIQGTLQQNANNFEALERQMVNILPGTAENAGPSSWSRLNSRVYARLADGSAYGQLGHLQIRVLPSSLATSQFGPLVLNAGFHSTDSRLDVVPQTDSADVPIGSILGYPNAQALQALFGALELLTGGNNSPASQARLVLELSLVNLELQPIETDLMWVDCTATSPNLASPSNVDTIATLVSREANLGTNVKRDIQELATIYDTTDATLQFLAGKVDPGIFIDTVVAPTLMQASGFNCSSYDATNAVKKAAQDYLSSLTKTLNKDTISVIQRAKGSLTLERQSGNRRIQIRLTLVPCSQSVHCLASLVK